MYDQVLFQYLTSKSNEDPYLKTVVKSFIYAPLRESREVKPLFSKRIAKPISPVKCVSIGSALGPGIRPSSIFVRFHIPVK